MTTYHIHMTIRQLLRYGDKRLAEMVEHHEGVEGARKELRQMLSNGTEYLVCDSTCDNRKPDGSCAGHTKPGEKAFP